MSRSCDVLVIGSGAGGLSAAVTAAEAGLKVIVAEKAAVLGGTTAWSGGWLWVPRNPLAVAGGIEEGPEGPLAYLASEIGNRARDPRVLAFLAAGPEMVSFFEEHSEVAWIDGNRIPDFHDVPGALEGGRSVSAAPYDARRLGDWAARLRPPLASTTIAGMSLASGADMAAFFGWNRSAANLLHVTRRLARHGRDLLTRGRSAQLVNGNALVARLLRSALDRGVEVLTQAPASELLTQAGRVTGAVVGGQRVQARRGVVLAAGGFPHDKARIAQMFDHAPTGEEHHSAAPSENTGDGLRLAEAVGAVVTQDYVNPGAWAPVSLLPGRGGATAFPHLIERAKPGIIAVGPDGRRFVNEADSYHDFMSALLATGADHAWLIADARARRRFGLGAAKPFPFPVGPHLRSGYLKRAATLAELAGKLGLPGAALEQTVTQFNAAARRGEDPSFQRGTSPYNRVQGDPHHSGPNPALGALEHAPFYALRLVPGSLGTFAGLATDASARVLDAGGAPIAGLFATGNDAASIMGGHYPSGGITLGPAMTFGYIAGRVLAERPVAALAPLEEMKTHVS